MRLPFVSALLVAGLSASVLAAAAPAASTTRASTGAASAATTPAKDASSSSVAFVRGTGSWFKDAHGDDWLGKPGKGDAQELDRLGNEQATAGIYRLASDTFGTNAPERRPATVDGKPYLMTKKVALSDARTFNDEQLKRFGDGFVVDAWLANWDVGGAWQLTADAAGRPVRVEANGAGLFRARGELKGAAFGDDVPELMTMRDPLRPISFGFRKLTARDVKDQLQRFAAWYPAHRAEVDAVITATSMSPAAAATLKAKLATRAQWLSARAKK